MKTGCHCPLNGFEESEWWKIEASITFSMEVRMAVTCLSCGDSRGRFLEILLDVLRFRAMK
jgi:hypothetical protein